MSAKVTPEAAEAARKVLVKRKWRRSPTGSLPVGDPVTIRHLQEAIQAAVDEMGLSHSRTPTLDRDWAEHARLANEPEGRTTGLHRDSMG